jgi:hypothetical protein
MFEAGADIEAVTHTGRETPFHLYFQGLVDKANYGAQIIVTRQSDLAVVFQSGVHLDDIEHLELTLPPLEKMIHSVHVHLLDLFPGLPLQERVLAMRHERMMVLGKVQTLN